MNSSSEKSSEPSAEPEAVSSWPSSLAAGAVIGALWGALEAAALHVTLPTPGGGTAEDLAATDPTWFAAVVLQGALRYGLVGLVLALPVAATLGRFLTGASTRGLAAARGMVALVVFVNLFWATKPFFAATWGLPFHHPKRLLINAVWVVAAGLIAWLVVRRRATSLIARGVMLAVSIGVLVWLRAHLADSHVGARSLSPTEGALLSAGFIAVWGLGLMALWPAALSPPRGAVTWAAALIVGGGGAWAIMHEESVTGFADRTAPEGDPPNVLYVVVDALRADRLGCYGYDLRRNPPISPRVDALAKEGVVFEKAVAQAPFTWTSFGSFLTGKYPRNHGLLKMEPNQRLDVKDNRTLARALADEGYVTGAFLTGTLSNDSGLLDGFDTYFEAIVGHEPVTRSSRWSVVRADMLLIKLYNKIRQALDRARVNTVAMDWIEEQHSRPFFALVHYYSTHTPYDPPQKYVDAYDPGYTGMYSPFLQSHGFAITHYPDEYDFTKADWNHLNALYDGGVREADDMFGDLLDQLERLGELDNTLIIFTSDHGEELYDHQVFEHDWMWNTNLYVPLVMRFPKAEHAGTRVEWPVEMIDIPPTVLSVTDNGSMPNADGRSLEPDAAGNEPIPDEFFTFSENVRYLSIQTDTVKMIRNEQFTSLAPRYFNLREDTDEFAPNKGVSEKDQTLLRERAEQYASEMPDLREQLKKQNDNEDSEESRSMLEELGYFDGTKSAQSADDPLPPVLGPNEMLEEDLDPVPLHEFDWSKDGEDP